MSGFVDGLKGVKKGKCPIFIIKKKNAFTNSDYRLWQFNNFFSKNFAIEFKL
jgi:hypothetical protein